jgi:hypothetical protein
MNRPPELDPVDDLPWPKATPSAHVSAAIHKHCTLGIEPCRGPSSAQRITLSLGVSFAVLAMLMYLSRGGGGHEGSTLRSVLIGAAGWGVVQALVLWLGFGKPPGRRLRPAARIAIALAIPLAFIAYIAFAAPEWVPFAEFLSAGRLERTASCGIVGLFVSALASGGVLLLWRGTDPLTPGLSGALAGLVGGIGGGIAIGAACPTQEGWHAGIAHGLVVVAFVAFGWVVGRRLLAP